MTDTHTQAWTQLITEAQRLVICSEELRATLNETDIMYTVSARAGLEAEKESRRRLPTRHLSRARTPFLTHTYFPSLSSKRPGVKM